MSDKQPIRLLVNGAGGRMGKAIIACAAIDSDVVIAGEASTSEAFAAALPHADVVIDFSHADVTENVVVSAVVAGKPLVIGTTGHTDDVRAKIADAAKVVPIVFAPNFSVGVNTLFWLTRKAAEILGPEFDLEIVEMHHRLKKDAPSGTARGLAEILTAVRNLEYSKDIRHGREGIVGERTKTEIGMHSLRGGDVVGDHTVIFANVGERVELTHKASSRDTFAKGSIHAAKWVIGQKPGLYSMQDVLGLA